LGPEADFYFIGMMLFELMTGRVNTVSIKLKETPSRM
jgi:hypothetical protein